MRLLLDTNVIMYILREREPTLSRFRESLHAGASFLNCDVVDYEIRRYFLLKEARRQLHGYETLSLSWEHVHLTRRDWREAARVWSEVYKSGQGIDDRDLLIAVSAVKGQASLVTANVRHFQNVDVPLLDWSQ